MSQHHCTSVCALSHYSLHRLNKAKARQQQVTVKLQDLHGFYQIVLSDDVLHTDPCSLILSRRQVICNLLPGFLSKLSLFCEWKKNRVTRHYEKKSPVHFHMHIKTGQPRAHFSSSPEVWVCWWPAGGWLLTSLPWILLRAWWWTICNRGMRGASLQPKLTRVVMSHLTQSCENDQPSSAMTTTMTPWIYFKQTQQHTTKTLVPIAW